MVMESWPPRDADEMLALQNRYGNDHEIAAVVGRTQNAVSAARRKLGVPTYKPETLWTDENIETLKGLWAKGLSAAQVAREIGGKCSRNAVIGKAHRLELPSRPSPIKKTGGRGSQAQKTKRHEAANLLNLNQTKPDEPDHGRVDGIQPYRLDPRPVISCQWIEREPGTPMCGKRSRPGKPYCAEHCKRAYLPPKVKA